MESSNHSDIKNINIVVPNKLINNDNLKIKTDIEKIFRKNEENIRKYLERIIYTSILSKDVNLKLDVIFEETKNTIMDNL
jgi:hypothetical protein